jgi:hypothetical protein
MRRDKSGGIVGALFSRGAELSSIPNRIASVSHVLHAVMLSIATAARRQACSIHPAQRKQRRDDGEAEHNQQEDGKKSTQ